MPNTRALHSQPEILKTFKLYHVNRGNDYGVRHILRYSSEEGDKLIICHTKEDLWQRWREKLDVAPPRQTEKLPWGAKDYFVGEILPGVPANIAEAYAAAAYERALDNCAQYMLQQLTDLPAGYWETNKLPKGISVCTGGERSSMYPGPPGCHKCGHTGYKMNREARQTLLASKFGKSYYGDSPGSPYKLCPIVEPRTNVYAARDVYHGPAFTAGSELGGTRDGAVLFFFCGERDDATLAQLADALVVKRAEIKARVELATVQECDVRRAEVQASSVETAAWLAELLGVTKCVTAKS